MTQLTEEDVKVFQQLIPGATLEKLQAFQECMKTEAIYKSAIPYGLSTTLLLHFLLPKHLGPSKSVVTVVSGFAAFMFGKVAYSPFCKEKIFGPSTQFAFKPEEKSGIDEQDQQSELVIPSSKLLEDDLEWKNYDTFSDNVNHFDDTGSNYQEGLITNQPTKVKKNVTYDDLWAQHIESQRKEQYRYRGKPINRETTVPPQRFSERATPPDTTFDEKNTWV